MSNHIKGKKTHKLDQFSLFQQQIFKLLCLVIRLRSVDLYLPYLKERATRITGKAYIFFN